MRASSADVLVIEADMDLVETPEAFRMAMQICRFNEIPDEEAGIAWFAKLDDHKVIAIR